MYTEQDLKKVRREQKDSAWISSPEIKALQISGGPQIILKALIIIFMHICMNCRLFASVFQRYVI